MIKSKIVDETKVVIEIADNDVAVLDEVMKTYNISNYGQCIAFFLERENALAQDDIIDLDELKKNNYLLLSTMRCLREEPISSIFHLCSLLIRSIVYLPTVLVRKYILNDR